MNAVDDKNLTALKHCAKYVEYDVDKSKDFADVARALVQNGSDVNLQMASLFGFVDVVKVLIQNGSDVNAVEKINRGHKTPLHFASVRGHADVAKVLIENGADVNALRRQKDMPSIRRFIRTCGCRKSVASERCRRECC